MLLLSFIDEINERAIKEGNCVETVMKKKTRAQINTLLKQITKKYISHQFY